MFWTGSSILPHLHHSFAELLAAAALGLLIAAPVSAAVTGTICGEVTAFTAPTAVTDGSITIDGTTEVIDSSASAAIDAGTLTTLTTVANADATTCLDVTANGAGEITDLGVAAQARICGTAAVNTTTGVTSVSGVDLPTSLVSTGSALDAYLDAAARSNANVCVDTTIDQTSGLITSVRLDATFTVCGDAVLDADSATLGGVDVPNTQLDAEAEAVLRLAASTGADTCMTLVVDDTQLVQANLNAATNLCGNVTLTSSGNAVVNGVPIDPALTSANAAALLQLAAEAAGTACASFKVTSVGGDTTVAATVTIDVLCDRHRGHVQLDHCGWRHVRLRGRLAGRRPGRHEALLRRRDRADDQPDRDRERGPRSGGWRRRWTGNDAAEHVSGPARQPDRAGVGPAGCRGHRLLGRLPHRAPDSLTHPPSSRSRTVGPPVPAVRPYRSQRHETARRPSPVGVSPLRGGGTRVADRTPRTAGLSGRARRHPGRR